MLFPRYALRLAIATLLLLLSPSFSPNIVFVASAVLAQETTPQDRKTEADRLFREGDRLLNEGQYQAALEQLQQALAIYRELGDRTMEMTTLEDMGWSYQRFAQHSLAIDSFQNALAISREIGNRSEQTVLLNNIGITYLNQSDYSQALTYFQQALAGFRDDGGTQVLMDAFYRALEQPGMTKAETLRQAQVALITGNYDQLGIEVSPQLARHLDRPYYWAPFILIGNGL